MHVERLRHALLECGQSINAISQATGLDKSNLGKFATEKGGISYENGTALAIHLGLLPQGEPAPPEPCQRCKEREESGRGELTLVVDSPRHAAPPPKNPQQKSGFHHNRSPRQEALLEKMRTRKS